MYFYLFLQCESQYNNTGYRHTVMVHLGALTVPSSCLEICCLNNYEQMVNNMKENRLVETSDPLQRMQDHTL